MSSYYGSDGHGMLPRGPQMFNPGDGGQARVADRTHTWQLNRMSTVLLLLNPHSTAGRASRARLQHYSRYNTAPCAPVTGIEHRGNRAEAFRDHRSRSSWTWRHGVPWQWEWCQGGNLQKVFNRRQEHDGLIFA